MAVTSVDEVFGMYNLNVVNDLAFATDDTLVTASSDHSAAVWTLDPGKTVREVCGIVAAVAATQGEPAPPHCPAATR